MTREGERSPSETSDFVSLIFHFFMMLERIFALPLNRAVKGFYSFKSCFFEGLFSSGDLYGEQIFLQESEW